MARKATAAAPPPPPKAPQMVPFADALSERYLAYALSTIMARSLPDVRDGLKPVHRRLLYAMRQLRLDSTAKARKSAAVVGDVMGNYHPHGDAAIYDAMVRLAQDFAVRYPLIDGQGNFGNIDGDNAAATIVDVENIYRRLKENRQKADARARRSRWSSWRRARSATRSSTPR